MVRSWLDKYKPGKMSRVGELASMVHRLADGTEKKDAGIASRHPVYGEPPRSAASIGEEAEAPPAASDVADDFRDDNDCDWEDAVALEDIERVCAKRHLREFQESCRAKKCKVPGTVAGALKFATELVKQDTCAEAGPLTELVSYKEAFANA